jgi:hypothetical protein
MALAGFLILLILACPFLDDGREIPNRVLGVFARDLAVRRTVIASSLGLVVTALVFFRPPRNLAFSSEPPDSEIPGKADP